MINTLYLAIEEKLKRITDSNNETLIKHFDLWNKQVEFIEQETPFETPAIFVEFMPMKWRTLGNRVQDCDLTVRLHIVTTWTGNTAQFTPEPFREQALRYLSLPGIIVNKMQNFGIAPSENFGGCNGWMRMRSEVNHNHERYVDSVEEYQCNLQDISAVVRQEPIIITPIFIKQISR